MKNIMTMLLSLVMVQTAFATPAGMITGLDLKKRVAESKLPKTFKRHYQNVKSLANIDNEQFELLKDEGHHIVIRRDGLTMDVSVKGDNLVVLNGELIDLDNFKTTQALIKKIESVLRDKTYKYSWLSNLLFPQAEAIFIAPWAAFVVLSMFGGAFAWTNECNRRLGRSNLWQEVSSEDAKKCRSLPESNHSKNRKTRQNTSGSDR